MRLKSFLSVSVPFVPFELEEGMKVISYTDKSTAAIDSFRYDFDTWNFDAGGYTLTAKATDVKGNSTTKI